MIATERASYILNKLRDKNTVSLSWMFQKQRSAVILNGLTKRALLSVSVQEPSAWNRLCQIMLHRL